MVCRAQCGEYGHGYTFGDYANKPDVELFRAASCRISHGLQLGCRRRRTRVLRRIINGGGLPESKGLINTVPSLLYLIVPVQLISPFFFFFF